MSVQYGVLSTVIATSNQGIKATYKTATTIRFLWPKALGQTNGLDRVICRELQETSAGSGHYTEKAWRCLYVDELTVAVTDMFPVQGSERPAKWKVKDLARQSCVNDVEFFR